MKDNLRTSIRIASIDDASSIALISLEVWSNTYLREGVNAFFADFALEEFTAQNFRARLDKPERRFWVSENAVGIDGFVELNTNAEPKASGCSTCEISMLYVQPRHHGSGKGAELLQTAIDHATELGFDNLWLTVNAENLPAIGFYERQGFENSGQTFFRIGSESYKNFIMRKLIP